MNTSKSSLSFLTKWILIGLTLISLYLLSFKYLIDKRPFVEWTMINVNSKELQADAHLLKMPDGKIILIDVGDPDSILVPYLKKQKVTDIDLVLISHMHKDHYGGLPALLSAGVRIKEIRLNLPDKAQCALEVPWGCDWAHIQETITLLQGKGIPVLEEKPGDIYYENGDTKLEVLYAYDGLHTPIGKTDLNNMSVLLRLSQGTTRVLYTGDLNASMGEYLARNHCSELSAQILKVPHHGTETVAPNSFFDCVASKVAMVPSPKNLWQSERSRRIREYFEGKHLTTYVNGLQGHVKVLLCGDEIKVKTAH